MDTTAPELGTGTEYGNKCNALAEFLHDMVFGSGQWAGNDEHYRNMYREDAAAAMGQTPKTGTGTEYGQALADLAEFLHSIPNGSDTWAHADESYRTNYTADAAELIALQPHLIDLEERRRLDEVIPALAP